MAAHPRHSGPEAGFTLVEVLAALAIFSLAALALVRVSSENTNTARLVELRAFAAIAADNRLAETLSSQGRLVRGNETEERELAGRTWVVAETVTATPNPLVVQIQVEARLQTPQGTLEGPYAVRTAFRAVPR